MDITPLLRENNHVHDLPGMPYVGTIKPYATGIIESYWLKQNRCYLVRFLLV